MECIRAFYFSPEIAPYFQNTAFYKIEESFSFSIYFVLAISKIVHRIASFYHLDYLCLVIPNAFYNDRYEEQIKILVV